MHLLDNKAFVDFISTFWNIWNYRNNAIFRGKEEDARVIWERARKLNDDFCIHNFFIWSILPWALKTCKWDVIKLNVDASVNANKTSLGIIVRDLDGFILSGKALFINRVVNSKWTELDAFLEGIRLAQSLNLDKVIFETNCAYIVNHFCKHKDDITIFGYHIKEARKMLDSFSKVKVK
ncbi:uncharacterized protein [Gossypium hirsutum]|uniref:RNase H type-1 domain-containing protein n=1 Tax=Gossypium hirsutum TaxID=3635 RepID=A0ABM3A8S5_GOSHI|nr:uncharacterized protein LOC121218292 [Gossypium hirsutum]